MKKPICLSFMLVKGGCGKTTISTNVAAALAAAGNKILFIDADVQGNATYTLGPKDKKDPGQFEPAMNDFLLSRDIGALDVIVTDTIEPNIHLFPNNLKAAQIIKTLDPLGTAGQVLKRLEEVLPNYDFVFFDCPPEATGLLSNVALICSDYVIAPIDGTYAASNLSALLDLVESIQPWNKKVELLGVVLNHWQARRIQANHLKDFLRREYPEVHIFNQAIPTSEQIRQAQAIGRTVPPVRGQSTSLAFQKLAKEIKQTIVNREKKKNPPPLSAKAKLTTEDQA